MLLVTGSTGRIGRHVVANAVRDSAPVRALVAPGVAPPWRDGPAPQLALGGYEDIRALRAAFHQVDAVLLLTPPDPRQVWWQRNIVDAAAGVGAAVVKISAFASRLISPTNAGRWHYDGELALIDSGLPHTVLRPQFFFDNLLRQTDEMRATGVLRTAIPTDHRIAMVDARDVADVAYERLRAGGHCAGILVPTGREALSPPEIASRIGAALGMPLRHEHLPKDAARCRYAAAGVPRWHADDMLTVTEDCGPDITSCVADATGRPPRTLENFISSHRAAFAGRI